VATRPDVEYRILVVEDEPKYLRLITTYLRISGYRVLQSRDGWDALRQVFTEEPHLVVLDLRLPEMDGFEVCQRIRKTGNVPILVLTALNTDQDMIRALDLGADDYVTKPFSPEAMLARIRALLRRTYESAVEQPMPNCGRLRLDEEYHNLLVENRSIHLTPTEWKLLKEFMRHCGKVLTHDRLLAAVWGPEYQGDHEYLRVYVRKLRSYIEPNPRLPVYLLTQAGIGYVLYPSPHGQEEN
jgi:two-component system KDP operon response regulator KdpE